MAPRYETAEALGKDARVSATAVRNVLNGTTKTFRFDDGVRIARTLGVGCEELAFGRGGTVEGETAARFERLEERQEELAKLPDEIDRLSAEVAALAKSVRSAGTQRKRERS